MTAARKGDKKDLYAWMREVGVENVRADILHIHRSGRILDNSLGRVEKDWIDHLLRIGYELLNVLGSEWANADLVNYKLHAPILRTAIGFEGWVNVEHGLTHRRASAIRKLITSKKFPGLEVGVWSTQIRQDKDSGTWSLYIHNIRLYTEKELEKKRAV